MPDGNDEIRKRILEDEPSELLTETWRAALVTRFDFRRKKLLAIATLQLLMGLAIFFGGAQILNSTPDLKLMLLATVIMLVGYETTVLIKLWYWVADTNLRVIREIKQLQLIAIGQPAQVQEAPAGSGPRADGWNWLSLRAAAGLATIVIVVAAILGTWFYLAPLGTSAPQAQREEHVRITAEGRWEIVARDQYPYAGVTPLENIRIRSNTSLENPAWREARLGDLPHTVSRDGQAYIYTVQFPKPIFRGESVDIRTFADASQLVSREGDSWTYRASSDWMSARRPTLTLNPARYHPTTRTVTLPPGAIVESVTPTAKMSWGDYDGSLTFSFETPPDHSTPQEIRITYRLPKTTQPANP